MFFFLSSFEDPKKPKSTGLKDLMENPIMEVDGKTGLGCLGGFSSVVCWMAFWEAVNCLEDAEGSDGSCRYVWRFLDMGVFLK